MTDKARLDKAAPQATEHFDVAIIGAGVSGVGAAYHLTKQCPGTKFVSRRRVGTP
jgi:cation diffusion facilitator CzcD-associated flavoprotein CzcO